MASIGTGPERPVKFIVQSGDWHAPVDFQPTRGVILARLAPGVYALYKYGCWSRISVREYMTRYASQIPSGLPVGWWGVVAKLYYYGGSYNEPISATSLNTALDRAPSQLQNSTVQANLRLIPTPINA